MKATTDETAEKNGKTFFYKCVLELILHPSTAWENQVVKIVIPYCTCTVYPFLMEEEGALAMDIEEYVRSFKKGSKNLGRYCRMKQKRTISQN